MSNKNNKLNKDMIQNIQNYGNSIETIEDYATAIRQTIGYHLGSDGTKGHLGMIKEIIQNSFDEAVRPYSPCNYISVLYNEKTLSISIEDNGRGIPFDALMRVYTSAYTSSNYTKEKGDYSAGTNGSGSKITLALSETFNVESYILGEGRIIKSFEGHVEGDVETIPNKSNKQGTIVTFVPSKCMGQVETTCEDVYDLLFGLFPLVPIGTTVKYIGIDKNSNIKYEEERTNKLGIVAGLVTKTVNPLINPVTFSDDNGTTKAEITFTYDTKDIGVVEDISSFSNFCITTLGGTHKDGFVDAICLFFRNYMNKIYLGDKSKITVVNNDIKSGLKAVVNVAHLHPIFIGQSKEALTNKDMYIFVKDLTTLSLENWMKSNPNDLQKLAKYLKNVAELRTKSDGEKIKLSNKYETSSLSGKPKKFLPPSNKSGIELVIVEGDSALGSAKNSRCSDRQGLFPIRGKIPNAFSTTKTNMLSNSEIASILTIIGGGHSKSFDISKVTWDKVILMADADPDGAHINSLLLRFFLLYTPDLISSGRLYRSVPPLYGVRVKGKHKYFTNTLEFSKYVQSLFYKNNTLTHVNESKLSANESIKIFVDNIDYVYELNIVSNTYAIDPNLLEDILIYKDSKDFNKIIKSKYRFIKIGKINNYISIDGVVNEKYHSIIIDDRLINSCSKVIDILKNNETLFYNVNGDIISLYQLMLMFERSMPTNMTRYKGLGEQDPKQLAESALHPDSDRTLIQYTISDIVSEIETMKYLESNKNELLKDISIKRQDIE